jgi:transcriptional regulator of arginine metabolism
MKQGRQSTILELIENHDVETQDELSLLLKKKGFEVTQATISRDIKELKLVKVQSESGAYKYAASGKEPLGKLDIFRRVFRDTVVSVEEAASLVVVHTMSGSANAAAEAIDVMELDDVAGTLAGDNTIFVAVKEEGRQKNVVEALSRMLSVK